MVETTAQWGELSPERESARPSRNKVKAKDTCLLDDEKSGKVSVPGNVRVMTATVDEKRNADGTPAEANAFYWASMMDWENIRCKVKAVMHECKTLLHAAERHAARAHKDYQANCDAKEIIAEQIKRAEEALNNNDDDTAF